MVRQYIGARYVPKFYQNSLNPLSNEWEENVTYEALTVVTYLSDSYTSKKPVPITVGNPRDNADYWSLTGAYNAQIEEYRQEAVAAAEKADAVDLKVGDLENLDTTDKTSIVNAINEVVNRDLDRKFIFIGDSYNEDIEGVTVAWAPKVVEFMGLSASDYYNTGVSGAGFCYGTTFLQQLQNLNLTDDEKESITDIVVCGGVNDVSHATQSDLYNAINTFCSHVKTYYPNATVSMGWISRMNNGDLSTTWKFLQYIETWEQTQCPNKRNITNAPYFYSNRLGMQSEANHHPNNSGAIAIASGIASFLEGGVKNTFLNSTEQFNGTDITFTTAGAYTLSHFVADNLLTVRVDIPNETLEFNSKNIISGQSIKLIEGLTNQLAKFTRPFTISDGTALLYDGTNYNLVGYTLFITNENLVIRFNTEATIYGCTKVIFGNVTFSNSTVSLIAQ